MKLKRKKHINLTKRDILIILFFNIFAIPLLAYAGLMKLSNNNAIAYLFGQVDGEAEALCIALGVGLEVIMFFVLAITKKKIIYALPNTLFIPVVAYISLLCMFGFSDTYETKLKDYDETLIINYQPNLFHGNTYIYKKTSVCTCEYITEFGDNCSYNNWDDYQIIKHQNGIEIIYFDDNLYLKYENGSFIKVETIEELV